MHFKKYSMCPQCGNMITATQFIFYREPYAVKCIKCKTKLIFPVPKSERIIFTVTGILSGIIIGVVFIALTFFYLFICGVLYLMLFIAIMAIYLEALYIFGNYKPVPK